MTGYDYNVFAIILQFKVFWVLYLRKSTVYIYRKQIDGHNLFDNIHLLYFKTSTGNIIWIFIITISILQLMSKNPFRFKFLSYNIEIIHCLYKYLFIKNNILVLQKSV